MFPISTPWRLSTIGKTLTLLCINRSLTRDIPAQIELKKFRAAHTATAEVLQANSLYDGNDEVDPNRVVPVDSTIQLSSGPVSYTFPHEKRDRAHFSRPVAGRNGRVSHPSRLFAKGGMDQCKIRDPSKINLRPYGI